MIYPEANQPAAAAPQSTVILGILKPRSPFTIIWPARVVPVRYDKARPTLVTATTGESTFQPCLLIPWADLVPADQKRLALWVSETTGVSAEEAMKKLESEKDYPIHQAQFAGIVEGQKKKEVCRG